MERRTRRSSSPVVSATGASASRSSGKPRHDGSVARAFGRHQKTYPSVLPMFKLDRICVRGFEVVKSQVRKPPWLLLSDHLAP